MAPRGLVIPWTIDDRLSDSADQARSMEIGSGVVACFVFIVGMAVLTLLNCACCCKDNTTGKAVPEEPGSRKGATPSPGASTKDKYGPGSSFDSSATVGMTTATRDSSKRQVSLRQATQQKGAEPIACNTSCVGLPVTAKTPTSSQQAPPTTLHAAPAFTDFVNESSKK